MPIKERIIELIKKIHRDKISKDAEDTKAGRNQNKTNPYKAQGIPTEQTGDDQVQQQQGAKPDYDGFLPMMSFLQRRRELRKIAINYDQVPGVKDPSQGNTSPWTGAGELPFPRERYKVKRWQDLSDKSRIQKKYVRNPENNQELQVEDQTPLDGAGD